MIVGSYSLEDELAHGGMATVHLGRLRGEGGFGRTVAIKRLHPQHAKDRSFVAMLVDEARIVSRVHHENVCQMLDVVAQDGELFLVMDYVSGSTVSHLIGRGGPIQWPLAIRVAIDALRGLHAAHEARDERGEPLAIVHRDVSPQNVMVGTDGVARVVDFGVAKAAGRYQQTKEGVAKGKVPYMAPEQLRSGKMTPRVDVYAASVMLWEMLVGERMIKGSHPAQVAERILFGKATRPSEMNADIGPDLDAIVMKGLERDAEARFKSAREMADALEALGPALRSDVAAMVEARVGEEVAARQKRIEELATVFDLPAPVEPSAPASSRSRRGLALALALVVLGGGVSFCLARGHGSAATADGAGSRSASAPPDSAATRGTSSILPLRSSGAALSASIADVGPIGAGSAPSTMSARRLPPPSAICDPPWTLDPSGNKLYKRECL
ncbi:hypothetical protein BH09MYX1_BH09MYX1_66830 [soil metagenome]